MAAPATLNLPDDALVTASTSPSIQDVQELHALFPPSAVRTGSGLNIIIAVSGFYQGCIGPCTEVGEIEGMQLLYILYRERNAGGYYI